MKTHTMTTPMVPESPVIDDMDEAEDLGDWRNVADCLPQTLRDMLLSGRKFGE